MGVAGVQQLQKCQQKDSKRICAYTIMPLMHLSRQTFFCYSQGTSSFSASRRVGLNDGSFLRGGTHLEGLCMHLQRPSRRRTTHDTLHIDIEICILESRILSMLLPLSGKPAAAYPVAFSWAPNPTRTCASRSPRR